MQRAIGHAILLKYLYWSRCSGCPDKWMAAAAFVPATSISVHRRSSRSAVLSRLFSSPRQVRTTRYDSVPVYNGPIFSPSEENGVPQEMSAIIELVEHGIQIAVGPSMVAPGQLGLYGRCCEDVQSVTLPECTLFCGYSKAGEFCSTDAGFKTVGFSLTSATTGVFFERELMEVEEALIKAADFDEGFCSLVGHELAMLGEGPDEKLTLFPTESGFDRYFCPKDVHHEDGSIFITVHNCGQYCNDLAWNQLSPPSSPEQYLKLSEQQNCVQLVWRLEYERESKCLVPTWPVSVLSRDIRFENQQFMELGTRYGWNYWQAMVDIWNIK